MCLIVSPICALTSESLDLETSFLVCRYLFRISGSSSYAKVKVAGVKTENTNVTKYTYIRAWLAFDEKAILFNTVVGLYR